MIDIAGLLENTDSEGVDGSGSSEPPAGSDIACHDSGAGSDEAPGSELDDFDVEREYPKFRDLFSDYLVHKTRNGPIGVEDDKDIYTYFSYFIHIVCTLENKNESFDGLDSFYAEVDNLFFEIYNINFDLMIQC